ncbi:MAG TPA: hypothetical protein DCP75_04145 [Haliea salexigens]|uniref:Uncharacterized protein n=1 Tax=Haliea salexigens TaxID=287487 RepID=A0A3C1KJU7_9GAMM|nr:hypothetical protein [Haliea sp.]HAN26905.1 hypothetical protein [Haliea salexigens]|tara:strand:+ start:402 stop:1187 length:786 start_codon:yes stop_codon:yes gene_type:complete
MRYFRSVSRVSTLLLLVLGVAACSGTTYNPTVFPYEVDQERLDQSTVKTVVIAHVNLGPPSRSYLEKEAPRIDGMVATYLKKNGYKVLPQRDFTQHWNTAVRAFGDPVDPTTGRMNMNTFVQIMQSVRDQLRENTDVDAVIFTDLLESEVPFSSGLNRVARWHGVTRKPSLQGPGSGVSTDFDWNQGAAVASLQISIYDMELKRLFASVGGLDVTDAIDARSSGGRFVRRRNILESDAFVNEGIALALHPFVEMEDWPGNP